MVWLKLETKSSKLVWFDCYKYIKSKAWWLWKLETSSSHLQSRKLCTLNKYVHLVHVQHSLSLIIDPVPNLIQLLFPVFSHLHQKNPMNWHITLHRGHSSMIPFHFYIKSITSDGLSAKISYPQLGYTHLLNRGVQC